MQSNLSFSLSSCLKELKDLDFQRGDMVKRYRSAIRWKHEFSWFNTVTRKDGRRLCKDIWSKVTTFLSDDELFQARGTCLLFYGAYYNQEMYNTGCYMVWMKSRSFDCLRAVMLAKMG